MIRLTQQIIQHQRRTKTTNNTILFRSLSTSSYSDILRKSLNVANPTNEDETKATRVKQTETKKAKIHQNLIKQLNDDDHSLYFYNISQDKEYFDEVDSNEEKVYKKKKPKPKPKSHHQFIDLLPHTKKQVNRKNDNNNNNNNYDKKYITSKEINRTSQKLHNNNIRNKNIPKSYNNTASNISTKSAQTQPQEKPRKPKPKYSNKNSVSDPNSIRSIFLKTIQAQKESEQRQQQQKNYGRKRMDYYKNHVVPNIITTFTSNSNKNTEADEALDIGLTSALKSVFSINANPDSSSRATTVVSSIPSNIKSKHHKFISSIEDSSSNSIRFKKYYLKKRNF